MFDRNNEQQLMRGANTLCVHLKTTTKLTLCMMLLSCIINLRQHDGTEKSPRLSEETSVLGQGLSFLICKMRVLNQIIWKGSSSFNVEGFYGQIQKEAIKCRLLNSEVYIGNSRWKQMKRIFIKFLTAKGNYL